MTTWQASPVRLTASKRNTLNCGGNTTLKERPIEANHKGPVPLFYHGIGLLHCRRHAAQQHRAPENCLLQCRDRRLHIRVVRPAMVPHAGREVPWADEGQVETRR